MIKKREIKEINKDFVLNVMSIAILIYAFSMLPSLILSIIYKETGVYTAMLIIVAVCLSLGFYGFRKLSNELNDVKLSVCYLTTSLTWILLIILSALPYFTSGNNYSFIDCIFESTASWTTTGASAINVEGLPIGLKVWRSSCNWLGGIGIMLLTISFLPKWHFIGQRLVSTEVRGPDFLMSTTSFRKAYYNIITIYVCLTLLQYLALRISGLSRLEALLTTLSNISTSGLQHFNNGVIVFLPVSTKIIITIFAFLSSINCSIYISLIYKKTDDFVKNSELNTYVLEIISGSVIIFVALLLSNRIKNGLSSFIEILMQLVSFSSTSGYILTDCSNWNGLAVSVVILISFIGACALSTGGGIKVTRFVFSVKTLSNNLFTAIHPNGRKSIYYNGKVSNDKYLQSSILFVALFCVILFTGAIALSIDGTDVYSAFSYSQAMLTNIGTPLNNLVDPILMESLSNHSKAIMSLLMLLGRLEIYPVIILFNLKFWKTLFKY